MKELCRVLEEVGKRPVNIGDRLMVLPFGGRIIGLSPDGNRNVFWVNSALQNEQTAEEFLNGDGWLNSGGDRTWISPELDTHGDPNDAGSYEFSSLIDPGNYHMVASDLSSVSLFCSINILFKRSGHRIQLELKKKISMIDSPSVDIPKSVQFAGYFVESELISLQKLPGYVRPGIWNILEVPGGGEIIIPFKGNAIPRSFYKHPVYQKREGCIITRVDTDSGYKFAVHADHCTGTMLYVNIKEDPATLIVRRFPVFNPSCYADVPGDDPDDTGYMQQFYVDDGGLGGYGEMEYHSPFIGFDGKNKVQDNNEVWAFSGNMEAIQSLSQRIIQSIHKGNEFIWNTH